ncbi:glycoside hydrolase [Massariosphaeria phaeospora]|uniref:lytic cellulose monooxygenase (C4-dehydrogenating) n=1 Tax=Massariosphaeria phaeospora TaxID=100035 RepID=A0A7C8M2J5_9PLEO|nr:glycoside hydrolase [Massariosphaeria phaeospora]
MSQLNSSSMAPPAKNSNTAGIVHGGPAQIYLAKVPANTDITKFTGYEPNANWFKIVSFAQKNDTAWVTLDATEVKFTIPKKTPPGLYLLRIEAFWPNYQVDGTQWYVNCAQVDIVGSGGGTPSGFAKFPGSYKIDGPGILVSNDQYQSKNLKKYVAPGPAVWTG